MVEWQKPEEGAEASVETEAQIALKVLVAKLAKCRIEQLLKVREAQGGKVVVVVAPGSKYVFTAAEVAKARSKLTSVIARVKPGK